MIRSYTANLYRVRKSISFPGGKRSFDSSEVPNRIKKYIQTSGHAQDLSKLSIEQRQLVFQHWVAYDLYSPSNYRLDSHFKCPLIACSTTFDSFGSCLAHLTGCAWLSNSWYWCPSCGEAEQFAEPIPALTSESKLGPASRIVRFVTSSTQKSPSTKSTTGRLWKHISNKLYFLSRPPRARDNTMGKAELCDNPSPFQCELGYTFSRPDDDVNDKPTTIATEIDGMPVQPFALGSVHPAATSFSPGTSYNHAAELESMHRLELHQSQLLARWELLGDLRASELPSGDGLTRCHPFKCIEASAINDTPTPTHPESRSELSTPANNRHSGSGPDADYSTFLADTPHYDHPPPYQVKTSGNSRDTQALGYPQILSTESNFVLPGGLTYSMPVEMPPAMPKSQQSSHAYEHRRQCSQNSLPAPSPLLLSSNRSDPLNSFQYTYSPQNHEINRPSSYQWPFTRERSPDDTSIAQVYSFWHRQASQSDQVKRTSVAKKISGQGNYRNYSQDSRLVSPMGSPVPYTPSLPGDRHVVSPVPYTSSLPEDPHVVSPTSSSDPNRTMREDQCRSLCSTDTVGPGTHSQALDEFEPYTLPSPPVSDEVHRLNGQCYSGTQPVASLSERYSLSTSSPLTSKSTSNRDSTRSNNISDTTQVTSPEASPVSPSDQESFEFTVTPQTSNSQESLKCPECSPKNPAHFTGSLPDQRSNLNRHILYCHGEGEKFKCPADGCNKEFSRPDNLKSHRRKVHKDVSPKRSNARRKRRTV